MANFYLSPISSDRILYELHATTDVSVSFKSSITSYPIETGSEVSDNVTLAPTVVSFSGVLTDVKSAGNSNTAVKGLEHKTLQSYIEELRVRQANKELFYVYFSGQGSSELEGIDKAILTDFDISKNPSIGTSWEVSVSLQEVRLASQAQITSEPETDYKARLQSKSEDSANTSEPNSLNQPKITEGKNLTLSEYGDGTYTVDGNP